MTKAERRRVEAAADLQIEQARLEILALKEKGQDLDPARQILAAQGINLDQLLSADSHAKRRALVRSFVQALPADPVAAQATFFNAYLQSLAGELACIATEGQIQGATRSPGAFAQN